MNAKQLRLAQEEIWEWISAAESASYDDAPDDDVLDMAREALNEVIAGAQISSWRRARAQRRLNCL